MSKILVTGAEGQLGQCFQALAIEYPIHSLFFLSKKSLDINKASSLDKVYDQNPFDGIINCAAYSTTSLAEQGKSSAQLYIAPGLGWLIDFNKI